MIHTAYFHPTHSPVDNKIVADFVSNMIWQQDSTWTDYLTMAVMEDGKLIAGTVFHGYDPSSKIIELSSASVSKKWLTRPVIRAMFHLPFNMLVCQMAVLRVSSENETMLKVARNFGFNEYVIPRLFGRDDDGHIFTLTEEQWALHRINKEAAHGQAKAA